MFDNQKNYFLFFIFFLKKYSIFRKHFLAVLICFLMTILKNNCTNILNDKK